MYIINLKTRQEYPLEKGPLLIGRTNDCDIFLSDTEVSRKHAYIYQENDKYIIEDLNSRNGIIVNGQTSVHAVLNPKDRVCIGQHEFLVSLTPIIPETTHYNQDTDTHKGAAFPFDMGDLFADFEQKTTADQKKLLNRIIQQLNSFLDCIRIINSYLDLEDILGFILRKAIELFDAERGAILLQSAENVLIPMVSANMDREIQINKTFSLSRSIIEQVQQHGRTILLEDALSREVKSSESIISSRIRSVLAAPIRFKDKILGIVYLDHREVPGVFSREDLHFFNAIASMAAIAVNNTERYNQRLSEREKYYQNKLFKYTEYLRARLVNDLKQYLEKPLKSLKKSITAEENSACFEILQAFSQSVKEAISRFSSVDLHASIDMVLDSERFEVMTLLNSIYKIVFPHAYRKGIKVFVERSQEDRAFIFGDLGYFTDLFAKVVFNVIELLEEGNELFLSNKTLDSRQIMLEIYYTLGSIPGESKTLDHLLSEKTCSAIKTYQHTYQTKVHYEAQENGRARITIGLPNRLGQGSIIQAHGLTQSALNKEVGRRVAVVHREKYYFAVLIEYLKRNFYQVSCFHNLNKLDAMMGTVQPDIMLLDYMMLESQPLHIEAVKAFKDNHTLPIILLSTTRNINREIFVTGIEDIMFVPFQIEELELRILHNIQNNELKRKLTELEKVETIKAMITSLSHEINNPLTTASINAELINMQHPGCSKYTNRIITSLNKVKKIVQEISNLKKVSFADYGQSQKMIHLESNDSEE